jgi:dienelactone hydrolase
MAQYGESQRAQAAPQGAEGAMGEEDLAAGIDPREILQAATEFAKENPHTAVAGAFAVGFLIGGGLTPRLLASIALFAGRRYFAQAAREALVGAVRQQIDEASAT